MTWIWKIKEDGVKHVEYRLGGGNSKDFMLKKSVRCYLMFDPIGLSCAAFEICRGMVSIGVYHGVMLPCKPPVMKIYLSKLSKI